MNGVFSGTAPKSAVFILNTSGLPSQLGRLTPSGTGTPYTTPGSRSERRPLAVMLTSANGSPLKRLLPVLITPWRSFTRMLMKHWKLVAPQDRCSGSDDGVFASNTTALGSAAPCETTFTTGSFSSVRW